MNKEEFKKLGFSLVEQIAEFIDAIDAKPVTTGETPEELKRVLGDASLPEDALPAGQILENAKELLFRHSLLNGHPKFAGYVTGAPAPIGALADLLAAAVNPNVGANILSPMATEIEKQTIKWLCDLVALPSSFGGLLVSGGNMANFTGFLAGRVAKAPAWPGDGSKLLVYCSTATHTWIEKAAVLFGLGKEGVQWIATGADNTMNIALLEEAIRHDLKTDRNPIMVIGTAGDVSTGAVDQLDRLADLCRQYDLWFHVDGAYGLPAAIVPEQRPAFSGIEQADSIALDPHKWLYAPLEAGCCLVKDSNTLLQAFSAHPVYYNFSQGDPATVNFYEYGLQNSRGFRALKVWMALQQAGRKGYEEMIAEDIRLSKLLFQLADEHPELEALTQHLSITTFRYLPSGIDVSNNESLNEFNESLLNILQAEGKVFMSNAVVSGNYCLRSCIVNFRTTKKDIYETVDAVVEAGRRLRAEWRLRDGN